MSRTKSTRAKELFYDDIAEQFDAVMNKYDLGRRLEIVFDQLLESETLVGQTVLDVGCGTGWFAQRAAIHGARVIAFDIGVRLLARTREKCQASLVAGDACRLPFSDRSVGIVVSSECVEHTSDPHRAVREMCRVLRPGGVLVLTVPNKVWRLSATFAAVFKLRPYEGLENWVWWWELQRVLRSQDMQQVAMSGFHLFPPVLRCTWPLLRYTDRFGGSIGPFMLNLAVKAMKRSRPPNWL